MNPPQDRIPEEKTQEVFTLAAQLYAQLEQRQKFRQSLFNRQSSRFNYSSGKLNNL
jgi:hypothetical protein